MTSATKESIPMLFPKIGEIHGANPIVVIGPNGVGKSRLMRGLINDYRRFISSQRRTYLEDQIPSLRPQQAAQQLESQLSHALQNPWQWSNEIDSLFAQLLQEHYAALYAHNEAAKQGAAGKPFVTDTTLDRLTAFWGAVFVNRKLSFADFSPSVEQTGNLQTETYSAKTMSDGERTCLYMAARVLTAQPGLLAIDEPELHMHRKLAIDYWNKLEEMRPDVRFVYVTHDLQFALSRRAPEILVVGEGQSVEKAVVDSLPPALIDAVLGAATLTINARRIIFFEGVSGRGVAHKIMKAWIRGQGSATLGLGNRNSVIEAARAFAEVGIIRNAQVIGLVDRDHGPDDWLDSLEAPARVLDLHEIESVLVLPDVLRAVAEHVGFQRGDPWMAFLRRARAELERGLAKAVAERVRARIDLLLRGVFSKDQIKGSVQDTLESHMESFARSDWSLRLPKMFAKEEQRVRAALSKDDHSILVVYSGKQALNDAALELGMDRDTYVDIVVAAITNSDHKLYGVVSKELEKYLPPRQD